MLCLTYKSNTKAT